MEIPASAGEPVAVAESPVRAAVPADPGEITTVQELVDFARELMVSARETQRAIARAVREGKGTQAYHLSLAAGIQLDKIGSLDAAVEKLEERAREMTEGQAGEVRQWLLSFGEALSLGGVIGSSDGLRLLEETRSGSFSRDLALRVREAAHAELDRSRRRALPEGDVLDAEPVADDGEEDGPAGDVEIAEVEVVEDATVEDAEVVDDPEPVQPSERPSPAEESLERLARRDGSSMHPVRGVSRGPRQSGYKRFGRAG